MKTYTMIAAGALLLMASCKPKEYEVSRELLIDAPPAVLFDQVNNLKNQGAWSPWEEMDPDMKRDYSGPDEGVGAKYSWSGNDEVGTGTMEHLEVIKPNMVRSSLVFTEPWQTESEIIWNFQETENGTLARWSVKGELPGFMFWMGQKDMDKMMGPDFEKGLNKLKIIAEEIAATPVYDVEIVETTSMPYYYIMDDVKISEVNSEFFANRYGQLTAFLGADMANMTAAPFAIYHKWDEDTDQASVSVALACKSKKPAKGKIMKGDTYAGQAAKVVYLGPYEGTGDVHNFLHSFIEASIYQYAGSPWEVYVTDPETEPDTSKWITEVYYPIAARAEVQ